MLVGQLSREFGEPVANPGNLCNFTLQFFDLLAARIASAVQSFKGLLLLRKTCLNLVDLDLQLCSGLHQVIQLLLDGCLAVAFRVLQVCLLLC